MNKKGKFLALAMTLTLSVTSVFAVGCRGHKKIPGTSSSITLDKENLSLDAGRSEKLSASSAEVDWKTSDPGVATVDENGNREVVFKVNGATHAVEIKDKSANTKALSQSKIMADEDNDLEIGANIPGNILKVVAQEGDAVKAGDTVAVIEAMKMETNVIAITDGIIDKIYVKDGQQVVSGELIAKLKEN